jgi:hypothetical protein
MMKENLRDLGCDTPKNWVTLLCNNGTLYMLNIGLNLELLKGICNSETFITNRVVPDESA